MLHRTRTLFPSAARFSASCQRGHTLRLAANSPIAHLRRTIPPGSAPAMSQPRWPVPPCADQLLARPPRCRDGHGGSRLGRAAVHVHELQAAIALELVDIQGIDQVDRAGRQFGIGPTKPDDRQCLPFVFESHG